MRAVTLELANPGGGASNGQKKFFLRVSKECEVDLLFTDIEQSSLRADRPSPLYDQLYRIIKGRILSGSIALGYPVPSEARIANAFGVSRITVSRALRMLVSDGLIERKRGIGYLVVHNARSSRVATHSFEVNSGNLDPDGRAATRLLQNEERLPPAEIATELHLGQFGTARFVAAVRLDKALPFAYCESWTVGLTVALSNAMLERHQCLDLLAESGVNVSHIEQCVTASVATMSAVDNLQLSVGDPVLTLERRAYGDDGLLLDLMFCQYHPERFKLLTNQCPG